MYGWSLFNNMYNGDGELGDVRQVVYCGAAETWNGLELWRKNVGVESMGLISFVPLQIPMKLCTEDVH